MWSPTGRSLISEGLRAAGLSRRNEEAAKGKRGHERMTWHEWRRVYRAGEENRLEPAGCLR
jgi:hypothetical protein